MARKAVATVETVTAAVEALIGEGLDPTVERVRAKLGGGSFTTINKVLGEVLAQRQSQAAEVSEVPADLIDIGQRAVASIYAAVQRQANAKIEALEADARKQIDAANRARAEAALEIERLEREGEQAAEALAAEQKANQDALARAERAEATAQASKAEIERLTHRLTATEAERGKIDKERADLERRLAKAEVSAEAASADLQKVRQDLERAREGERRARDEAAELRGQLKAAGERAKK